MLEMSQQLPRPDFRENSCLRAVICAELGSVGEAVGSARFSSGKSEAWASVYGPSAPKYARHERHDRASLEVELLLLGEPLAGREQAEKEGRIFLQTSLQQALQLSEFPRMLILIKVCVTRDDGCCLSVALNSCVLSLLDACLPMYFVPVILLHDV